MAAGLSASYVFNTFNIMYRVPNGLKSIGYGLDDTGDPIPAEAKKVFLL
jgi:hypothetical protein